MAVTPTALLIAQLLPLVPGIVSNALQLIEILRAHPETPVEVKAHLDQLAVDLTAINLRVQAMPLVRVPE